MESLDSLINALKKFPSLGPKSARRVAFYLLRQDDKELERIGSLISGLRKNLVTCSQCGNISSNDPCNICTDPLRDRNIMCVVDDVESLSAFEQSGIYNGLYHVLGARISGGLSDESAEALSRHTRQLKPDEVIIATSPRIESDISYYEITDILRAAGVDNVTRIAYGLPLGGSIEFADRMTLHTALEGRRKVS
ncbi:MAG: recombination protein RecR [Synergistaceae bacterium]|nr:recombination protein RecR [Synergistaceae bacterium]